jgi:transcriptional regulator with PAS, ATPase and Fis domain
LITVNCSAIPENLAESQFFGQIVGAFTSAAARPGFFRAAHGGTLFLDEIGDLPLVIQPKLLRALEEGAVIPLGATTPVPVDVRIVAATNRDLRTAIAKQQFRGDLYARLAQLEVCLPPLRGRCEDVLLLLVHALGEPARRLAPRLAEALLLHTWPFNVREVFSIAKELRVRSAGAELLDLLLVADRLRPVGSPTASARTSRPPSSPKRPPSTPPSTPPPPGPNGDEDDDANGDDENVDGGTALGRDALEALLEAHHGVVIKAALAAGRSRRQVYRWIGHHGIDLSRFRGNAR